MKSHSCTLWFEIEISGKFTHSSFQFDIELDDQLSERNGSNLRIENFITILIMFSDFLSLFDFFWLFRLTSAEFPPGFKNSKKLVKINLSNNKFPELKKSAFQVFGYPGIKLATLKLSRCQIESIGKSQHSSFPEISVVIL